MVDISQSNVIQISRGDTVRFPLFLNRGNETCPIRYMLSETTDSTGALREDELYVAVMEPNQSFEDALIKQKYTSKSPKTKEGDTFIRFSHDDTTCVHPGTYFYEIKLKHFNVEYDDYDVDTVVDKTLFYIQ